MSIEYLTPADIRESAEPVTAYISGIAVPLFRDNGDPVKPWSDLEADLRAAYLGAYDLVNYGRSWTSEYSGLCPLCTRYYQARRSTVVKLSESVPIFAPDPQAWQRGYLRVGNNVKVSVTEGRRYAHLRCAQSMTGGRYRHNGGDRR